MEDIRREQSSPSNSQPVDIVVRRATTVMKNNIDRGRLNEKKQMIWVWSSAIVSEMEHRRNRKIANSRLIKKEREKK